MKLLLVLGLIILAKGVGYTQTKTVKEEVIKPKVIYSPGLYVIIKTTLGTITCKLFEEKTPITVANFVGLAKGEKEFIDPYTHKKVKRRFYDGLIFHRVIPNFMIQGGCPFGTGIGGPGYFFKDEICEDLKFDRGGRLAMANAGPNTNGSQFFITEVPTPWLDGKHTIFGQVVEGLEVVKQIARVKRDINDKPLEDVVMEKVSIVRIPIKVALIIASLDFRDEEYLDSKEVFIKENMEVITFSTTLKEVKGMLGAKVRPDLLLKDLKIEDYQAIVLIGGSGASQYWEDKLVHKMVILSLLMVLKLQKPSLKLLLKS
jgi:peptidyl-prolyl cis-trans isomerase A (cyclophilin A)